MIKVTILGEPAPCAPGEFEKKPEDISLEITRDGSIAMTKVFRSGACPSVPFYLTKYEARELRRALGIVLDYCGDDQCAK